MRGAGPASWLIALGLASVAGCVPALRSPEPLAELAAGAPHVPAGEVAGALVRAEVLYDEAHPQAVAEAAELWLGLARHPRVRTQALVGATRALAWLAREAEGQAERERRATEAVRTAQTCRVEDPEAPPCAYWLGVALGLQARERRATATDALPRIVALLEEAAAARPEMDHAGPHRVLALVLLRAPGWPLGPGDPAQALVRARAAVRLDADWPPNQLVLAEALDAAGQREASREAAATAARLARVRLAAGSSEAEAWIDQALAVLEGRQGEW